MGIIDLIYPKMCSGCRREGRHICEDCQRKIGEIGQICPMCCKPSLDGWTHPRCQEARGMERLIVGLPYRGVVQQCLKKIKYKSAWEIINFLFEVWKKKIGFQMLDSRCQECIVTSVPMWSQKERERGFNQAKILAELMGESMDLLERVRETRPQYGLKKEARRENVEGAFMVRYECTNEQMKQRIILVDDVWTTGATMRECARVLKENGVKEVWGVALAR